MRRLNYFLFLLLFCLQSCYYYRLVETNSDFQKTVENIYENDSIKIYYSFWEEDGTTTFSIYNKLNIPIYIDWFKSSLYLNGKKYSYWNDDKTIKSNSAGLATIRPNNNNSLFNIFGASVTSSIISSKERITFIAPRSAIIQPGYSLLPFVYTDLPDNEEKYSFSFKEKHWTFSSENTPLSIRNFLTYSTKEDFNSENYIDNFFWVTKVSDLKVKNFKEIVANNQSKNKYRISWYHKLSR